MPRSGYVLKRLEEIRNAAERELMSPKSRRGPHEPPECTYGIRAGEIARRCGVDVSTARRW